MKRGRTAAIVCGALMLFSLLFGLAHPFGDVGPYTDAPSQTPIDKNAAIPADVRAILTAKCADCHSMETRLPVYDRVAVRLAPASWLIERDIVDGRKAMNLDAWGSYSAAQQQVFAAKMVQETRSRAMPLLQYRVIHRHARVTDADVRVLAEWARGLADVEAPQPVAKVAPVRVVVAAAREHVQSPVAVAVPDDVALGKDVFERRCTGCHAMNEDREGPRMQGVYGRAAGSVAGFAYSKALKQAHLVWNDATLEQWLADPDTLVPENDMDFHVAKAEERRELIRYLQESAGR